jgi:hypothetical protein
MSPYLLSFVMIASVFGANDALANCRSMESPAEIPQGWHPVTVQWYGDDRPDLVCIEKDGVRETRVSHWMGTPLPPGYDVLRVDRSLNPTFKGCAQFSTWQGVNTCMTSWPTSYIRKRGSRRDRR